MRESVHKRIDSDLTIGSGIFGEEDKQQERFERERERLIQLKEACTKVMSTEEGRRFVAWVIELAGVEDSVTSMDPQSMLYRSAQRDLGLTLRTFLKETCPNLLKTLEEEADGRSNDE